jgi:hypothetical protein
MYPYEMIQTAHTLLAYIAAGGVALVALGFVKATLFPKRVDDFLKGKK